jgi:hypothetical protein
MLLKWVEIAWWCVFSVFCLTSLPLHPLELDVKVKFLRYRPEQALEDLEG